MIPVAFASEAPRELPVVAAARRADEMRAEVRAALSDVLDEALAPLHASLRELERRLDDVERRPLPSVAPTTRSDAQSAAVRARHDPFASVPAPAMRAPRPSMPVSYAQPSQTHGSVGPQAPAASLDFDVPFDGAKRRRKLATTFAVMLVLIFGALFAALAFSYNRGG